MSHQVLWKIWTVLLVAVLSVSIVATGSQRESSDVGDGRPSLMGTIRATSGQPLGGVAVSARAVARTFTTTVFTDEGGQYVFPPVATGQYRLWAQAVGFATAKAGATLSGEQVAVQDWTLQPLADFTLQLTGSEWLAALPEDTTADRRLKQIFRVTCSDCHEVGLILQNRFDEAGWKAVIKIMEESTHGGWSGRADPPNDQMGFMGQLIRHHRDELASYLARMRGPGPSPMKIAPGPRPSGEAARVVVTEYDLPIWYQPDQLAWYNGSDWSEGPGTGMHGAVGIHDVTIDAKGHAWLVESNWASATTRTFVVLDPQTGRTVEYSVFARDGSLVKNVDELTSDEKGVMWGAMPGFLVRADPLTETFTGFTAPRGMGPFGNSHAVDRRGRVWSNTRYGSTMFDPSTNKWRLFQHRTVGNGTNYAMAFDAEGHAWWTQFQADLVTTADPVTGLVQEIAMRDPGYEARLKLATREDMAFYEEIGSFSWGDGSSRLVHFASGPRRLAADGNAIWVPNWAGMNLARIDARTHKVTYYPLPIQGHPYNTGVDRHHNVYAAVPLADSLAKFNPKTRQWTMFRTGSLGCNSRNVFVDQARGEVWVPCEQTSRVVRFQFRTTAQIEALKAAGGHER